MMPLDSVTMNNAVNRWKAMNTSLQALKSAGVEGIMMDVWWGLVEREAAGLYSWGGYGSVQIGGFLGGNWWVANVVDDGFAQDR